jgi:hypothetical protein
MTTRLEFRRGQFLVELRPVVNAPGRYLEVLDLMSEVGHVFGRESIV